MRACIIVPTYNEAANLPELSERLLSLPDSVDVLIVDDASPDGTGQLADEIAASNERFHVLHRTGPRGYAPASREGLGWALGRDFDVVCTMDADLSHKPETVPLLLRRLVGGSEKTAEDAPADLVIGSRYVSGGELRVDWGPVRRAVSRLGSRYARAMTGAGVNDCTSGFRCYRASVLQGIDLGSIKSEGYSFLIEMLAMLRDSGARIVEVPIVYVDRQRGSSKISRTIILEALVRTTGIGLRRLLRSGPAGRTRT